MEERSAEEREGGGEGRGNALKIPVDAPTFVPKSQQSNPNAPAFVPASHREKGQSFGGALVTIGPGNRDEHGLPDAEDDVLGMSSGDVGSLPKDFSAQAAQMFREMTPAVEGVGPSFSQSGDRSMTDGGSVARLRLDDQASRFSGLQKEHSMGKDRKVGRSGEHSTYSTNPRHMAGQGFDQHLESYQQLTRQESNAHRYGSSSTGHVGMTLQGEARGRGGRGRGRGRGGRGGGRGGYNSGNVQLGKFVSGFPGSSRPSVSAFAVTPGRMQLAGQFMSETLRADMQQRNFLARTPADSDTLQCAGLPDYLQHYHTLYPLEDPGISLRHPSTAFGVFSLVFRGIHDGDGSPYALRKVDGNQVVPTAELLSAAEGTVQRWLSVANHPNVVGLREVFVSDEVDGTPALFFSYDFYPGAYTLGQAHVEPVVTSYHTTARMPATEQQLWSYLVQLTSAIREIHSAGLVIGSAALSPSKILLMSPLRVRLGAVGLEEALKNAGAPSDVTAAQRNDLASLGTLILTLACAARDVPPSLDFMAAHYSRDLSRIVAGLLAAPTGAGFSGWRPLIAALGDRVFSELDASNLSVDTVAQDLQKECENGRLARLLIKLSMVVERSELLGDERWSETGDRYLLKLFRDFVFHGVDENGRPRVEWGGIIEALNKADAGVNERIMLLSRDESSMLVVSYADVRRCLQMAYDELKAASRAG